jgi:hypothetical protein
MSHNGLLSESVSRRSAIFGGAVALVGGALAREALGQAHDHGHAATNAASANAAATERRPPATSASPEAAGGERQTGDVLPPGEPGRDYTPVVVPNGATLPWKIVDGWKVYHLVVEEFEHVFAPGLTATCWGYNGHTPGPVIEAVEGDRVRIYVTNKLPAPTSVHWHGILLPNGMDGVSGLNQKPAEPGETIKYEFVLRQHGTHMYHSHHDEMTQQALGLTGLFVIHPRTRPDQRVDRDFAILLGEWRIDPGTHRPDPLEMSDFNILTMNGKAFPGTDALVIRQGQRARVRFGNLGPMDHHPIHLHGYRFTHVENDGEWLPESARRSGNTVLVPVGGTRAFEFVADEPGDWAMHCHMSHHMMNQMGHDVPNMVGVKADGYDRRVRPLLPGYMTMGETGMGEMGDMGMAVPTNTIPMLGAAGPFAYITMGGMFSIVKVRPGIQSYEDPGWYKHPEGTVVRVATDDDLKRDGINGKS